MRAALFACLIGTGIGAGACGGPQLELVLVRAEDLAAAPPFVKFQVREADQGQPQEFGPFNTNTIPDENFAPVKPGTQFYVDAIGCQLGDAERCVEPTTFIARGCTPFFALERGEARSVTIEMHKPDIGAESCPPPPP